MTKFEQVGINMQMSCGSIYEANRKFEYSCEVCCCRGINIQCDHCAIEATHKMVVAALEPARKVEIA